MQVSGYPQPLDSSRSKLLTHLLITESEAVLLCGVAPDYFDRDLNKRARRWRAAQRRRVWLQATLWAAAGVAAAALLLYFWRLIYRP